MKRRIKEFTVRQRHLPHWEMPGATYHVVFKLKDNSGCVLTRDDAGPIILNTFAFYANERYFLYDHNVMPDHVHAILQPIVDSNDTTEPLFDITGDIKSYTAREINKLFHRHGALWIDESYDRIIRDRDEFDKVAKYIFENPMRAGLIDDPVNWKWWRPGTEPPR